MTNEEACLEFLKMRFSSNSPEEADRFREAIKKALIALRNQQEWIPCSERLPGIKEVLTSNVSKISGRRFVDKSIWFNGGWRAESGTLYKDLDVEVEAWMPLPPAYRGGDAE